jgi:hypothetical protein
MASQTRYAVNGRRREPIAHFLTYRNVQVVLGPMASAAVTQDWGPSWVMIRRHPRCKKNLTFGLRSGTSHVSGLFARYHDRWP